LSQAPELADPLYDLYQRRALSGTWRGLELRTALGPALIYNQKDNRLEADWRKLVETGRHDYLIGERDDGFEAVLLMPPSEEQQGEPSLDALGATLRTMTEHLEHQAEEERESFVPLVNRVIGTYPGRPTWSADLIRMADGHYWPSWAIMCLPELFVEADKINGQDYYLWEVFLPVLDELGVNYDIIEPMCKVLLPQIRKRVSLIYHLEVSDEALGFLKEIVPKVEFNRKVAPSRNYRQVVGSANQAFIQLENAFADNDQTFHEKPDVLRFAIRAARHKLLNERMNLNLPDALVEQPAPMNQ
jgi:hypothetical protein